MSLPHALLVSLMEKPSSGIDLTRRFSRSIGFFWKASHQQIYRELGRMTGAGWVLSEADGGDGRRKVYSVLPAGRAELLRWAATPHRPADPRDALMVRLRAAAILPEIDLRADLRRALAGHEERLAHYRRFHERDFAGRARLSRRERVQAMILRKGVAHEQWEIDWTRKLLAFLDDPDAPQSP